MKRFRRDFSDALKRKIVAEANAPGSSVSAVAKKHGVATNLIYLWRRDSRFSAKASAPFFLPVVLKPDEVTPVSAKTPGFDIVFTSPSGVRIEVTGISDADLASALVRRVLA